MIIRIIKVENALGLKLQDLSFKPVSNAGPKHLTQSQIEAFNRNGFVRPLDVFPFT